MSLTSLWSCPSMLKTIEPCFLTSELGLDPLGLYNECFTEALVTGVIGSVLRSMVRLGKCGSKLVSLRQLWHTALTMLDGRVCDGWNNWSWMTRFSFCSSHYIFHMSQIGQLGYFSGPYSDLRWSGLSNSYQRYLAAAFGGKAWPRACCKRAIQINTYKSQCQKR